MKTSSKESKASEQPPKETIFYIYKRKQNSALNSQSPPHLRI